MKLLKNILIVMALFVLTTSINAKGKWEAYGGIVTTNVEVSGLKKDTYLNGFKEDASFFDRLLNGYGKMDVEKSNKKTTASGVLLGGAYVFAPKQAGILDFTLASSGAISATTFNIGYRYKHSLNDKMSVSGIVKVGSATVSVNAGELKIESIFKGCSKGGVAVRCVDLDGDYYEDGHKVKIESSGTVITLMGEANYAFTPKIDGFFQLGYQSVTLGKAKVTVNNKEVSSKYVDIVTDTNGDGKLDSNDVFASRTNNKGLDDVKMKMGGVILGFGVAYKFY